MMTHIYKIRSEIWVAGRFSRNLAAQKRQNFGSRFAQIRDLIANMDAVLRLTTYARHNTGV